MWWVIAVSTLRSHNIYNKFFKSFKIRNLVGLVEVIILYINWRKVASTIWVCNDLTIKISLENWGLHMYKRFVFTNFHDSSLSFWRRKTIPIERYSMSRLEVSKIRCQLAIWNWKFHCMMFTPFMVKVMVAIVITRWQHSNTHAIWIQSSREL